MAKGQTKRIDSDGIRRGIGAIIIIAFIVTVVASVVAGTSASEVIFRSLIVVFCLSVIARLFVATFNAWEKIAREKDSLMRTRAPSAVMERVGSSKK